MATSSPQKITPQHLEALYRDKRVGEAERLAKALVASRPGDVGLLVSLGQLAMKWRCNDEALLRFDAALRIRPKEAGVHMIRGHVLVRKGLREEGIAALSRAIELAPGSEEVVVGAAQGLIDADRSGDALRALSALRELKPALGQYTLLLIARLLGELDRPDEAEAIYREQLERTPEDPLLLELYAGFLAGTRRAAEAARIIADARVLHPAHAGLQAAELNVQFGLGNMARVLETCSAITATDRGSFIAAWGRVRALAALGRLDEARSEYRALVETFPGALQRMARDGLVGQPRPHPDSIPIVATPESEFIVGWHARLKACDWCGYEEQLSTAQSVIDALDDPSAPWRVVIDPYLALMLPLGTPAHVAAARAMSRLIAEDPACQGNFVPLPRDASRSNERLHIAYLSADFRKHAVAVLIKDMFSLHDRSRFTVSAYSLRPSDHSRERQTIEANCDRFIELYDLTNEEAAQRIRDDRVDILIDLTGYTRFGRPEILARRPAPVQVQYLGFAGSMAAGWVDYCISAPRELAEVEAHEALYSERIAYLPGFPVPIVGYEEGAPSTRAEHGLPASGFVFCCFQRADKLDPVTFSCWMRILARVPGSVLWLLSQGEVADARLRREAGACGLDQSRLIFAGLRPVAEHVSRSRLADLFLDTVAYGGPTVSSMAVWSGLPVLTVRSTPERSNSATLLNALGGCPELIVNDLAEYEEVAVRLGTNPEDARALRLRLESGRERNPCFDAKAVVRSLEAAYLQMWSRYEAGEPPASFDVKPALDDGAD